MQRDRRVFAGYLLGVSPPRIAVYKNRDWRVFGRTFRGVTLPGARQRGSLVSASDLVGLVTRHLPTVKGGTCSRHTPTQTVMH